MKKSHLLATLHPVHRLIVAFFVLAFTACTGTNTQTTVDSGTSELAARAAQLAEQSTKETPDPLTMPNKTAYTIPIANFAIAGQEGYRASASLSITITDLVMDQAESAFRDKLPQLQSKARGILQSMSRGELEVLNSLADSQRRITTALDEILGSGWVTSVELLALSIQE